MNWAGPLPCIFSEITLQNFPGPYFGQHHVDLKRKQVAQPHKQRAGALRLCAAFQVDGAVVQLIKVSSGGRELLSGIDSDDPRSKCIPTARGAGAAAGDAWGWVSQPPIR
jgi:hypothetical protein